MKPRLRALLIGLVLLVNGFSNLPATAVKEKDLKNPIARQELQSWSELLGHVGVERTPAQLREDAVRYGNGLAELKKRGMKPFRPAFRLTGTGQGWGLFTYPNTFPHTLHVDIDEGGSWRTVYAALDPEADWMEGRFRFRRVRGVYDDNAWKARRSYENFVDWVAREAFEDFPEANQVSVYMIRRPAREVGQPSSPDLEKRLERTRTRP